MKSLAEFVHGTLAYLANCAIALMTLTISSLRLRPLRGALRCKVRAQQSLTDVPDGRAMLFLAACIFGTVCTYALHGFAATIALLSRAAVGAAELPKSALVTSVLCYVVCEWAIAQATTRAIAPGRRGGRSRQILRFLLAALLIQITVYEPLIVLLLSKLPDLSGATLTGHPDTHLDTLIDGAALLVRVAALLAPFLYLLAILERSKRLVASEAGFRALSSLPVNLLGAGLAGSLLTAFLYPPTPPKLVTLHCVAVMGSQADIVSVEALFRNDSENYWTPAADFKVNILGEPQYDPFFERTRRGRTYSEAWAPVEAGEGPERILVGPHQELRFKRHVVFGKGFVGPQEDNGCSLSTERPPLGLFDAFQKGVPEEPLGWVAVEPTDFKEGELGFRFEKESKVPPVRQQDAAAK